MGKLPLMFCNIANSNYRLQQFIINFKITREELEGSQYIQMIIFEKMEMIITQI
jgi:hypothetical protein